MFIDKFHPASSKTGNNVTKVHENVCPYFPTIFHIDDFASNVISNARIAGNATFIGKLNKTSLHFDARIAGHKIVRSLRRQHSLCDHIEARLSF